MAFFVVVTLDIDDSQLFAAYGAAMANLLKTTPARVICASDDVTVYEGSVRPQRVVLFEWPSRAAFESFRNSADYQAIVGMRLASASTTVVGVSA